MRFVRRVGSLSGRTGRQVKSLECEKENSDTSKDIDWSVKFAVEDIEDIPLESTVRGIMPKGAIEYSVPSTHQIAGGGRTRRLVPQR